MSKYKKVIGKAQASKMQLERGLKAFSRRLEEYNSIGTKSNEDDYYEPSEEEKARYTKFKNDLTIAVDFRREYDVIWQECVARYQAKPFYYEDGRAGVVLPIGKFIVETAQAQESKSPPSFSYSASEYKEDIKKAGLLEFVVKRHVWHREYVNLDYKMDVLNQDKAILGTMYQYVGWRTLYRQYRKWVKKKNGSVDRKGEGLESEYEIKVDTLCAYDDIVVDNLYPQDVWLHPFALCVAESPWVFIRRRYDYETFLETFSDSSFYKNVKYVKKGSVYTGWEDGGESLWKPLINDKDNIVVMEKWNKITDEVQIYANNIEIYYGPNPYEHKELPIADYRNRLQFNTYLGESEMERIATISDALNAFINIAIDKEKRAAIGLNLLDNNMSDFDDVESMFSSTEAVRVESPRDSFVHYDMPGMSASTNNMIQMLMDFLVYATGIDYRQITDLSSSVKATVAALRREISQQRINLNVTRNENCGVKRLGWLLGRLVMQYYPLPLVEEVTGQDLDGDNERGEIKAKKKKYREIRVQDHVVSEVANKDGEYNADSLRLEGKKTGEVSFFEARPEYLRLKGDISVKVIQGSTMAAIAELKKGKAMEYIKFATEIMKPPTEPGAGPKPILSIRYGLEKLIEAMEYDIDRAFNTSDNEEETTAQDEVQDIVAQMGAVFGNQKNSGGEQIMPVNLPMPKNIGQKDIAGVQPNNPILKDLANEMQRSYKVNQKV